jgi:hypothetical protein
MGLRIHNPNDLTPVQWAAVEGLLMGRDRYDDEAEKLQRANNNNPAAPG